MSGQESLEFRVLGPMALEVGGRSVALPGIRPRRLLACLVLHVGRSASVASLIDAVWGDDPPPSAAGSLQSHASRLRIRLGPSAVAWTAHGYRLDVESSAVDARRFEDLVGRARAASRPDEAIRALEDALALWRGDPYPDLAHHDIGAAEAARLTELRVLCQEDRAANLLALDLTDEAVAELRSLTVAQPLRERPWQHLMLALHRSGRQAEALSVFQNYATVLAEEGLEPSSSTKDLRSTILSAPDSLREPMIAPPPAAAGGVGDDAAADEPERITITPAQLPTDTTEFVGRLEQLDRLDHLVGGEHAAVRVALIVGTAGVGKTALALRWGHRAARRFPDGQLYVDLRGHTNQPPMRPVEALALLLGGLGLDPARVPVDPDQASSLYRSALAGRRMLVILDNAASAAQVRPLLPGSSTCAVVVTSRSRLAGLTAREGATAIRLDVLDPTEAVALLRRRLGGRLATEPAAAAELAGLCARLPLALRIAAANLLDHPHRSISGYVADLTNASDRLALLRVDDDDLASVRPAFELSYATLTPSAARLFRILGVFPGPELSADAAAAMTEEPVDDVARDLEALATAHLVDPRGSLRYGCHDLLRYYARQQADAIDPPADHHAARQRLMDWYLRTVDAAARVLYPHLVRLPLSTSDIEFTAETKALDWLESERANLVAAVVHSAEHGLEQLAWLLADALRGYLGLRGHMVDWLTVATAARAAAERVDNPLGQAAARFSLAVAYAGLSQYPQAVEEHTAALELAREANWVEGEDAIPGTLGRVYWEQGRLDRAVEYFGQALASAELSDRPAAAATARVPLAGVLLELGRLNEARDQLERALRSYPVDWEIQARALAVLGHVYWQLGQLGAAQTHLSRSLGLARRMGARSLHGVVLLHLADVCRDAGRAKLALIQAEEALALAREVRHLGGEATSLNAIGAAHLLLDDRQRAVDAHRRALRIARQLDDRFEEAQAHLGLAETGPAAARHAAAARDISQEAGYQILLARSLTALASAALERDNPPEAIRQAEAALKIQRAAGNRINEARTLLVLAEAWNLAGDEDAAGVARKQAQAILRAAGAVEPAPSAPRA